MSVNLRITWKHSDANLDETISNVVERYKVLFINFIIIVGVYSVWIFNQHYAIDSYAVFAKGMTSINIQNGRIVAFFIYKCLELLHWPVWENLLFTQMMLSCTISLISFQIYKEFVALTDKSVLSRFLVQMATLGLFINVSLAEGWFNYPETCFSASISLYTVYFSIRLFIRYCKQRKTRYLLLSFLALSVALQMYQVYVETYVALCTIYIIAAGKGCYDKHSIMAEIAMVVLAAIASVISILVMKVLGDMGVSATNNRAATADLSIIVNNLKWMVQYQPVLWSNFNGFMSHWPLTVLLVMDMICLALVLISGRKIFDCLFTIILFLGSYVMVFAPHLVSSYIWCAPRTIYGFFVVTMGMVMIIAAMNKYAKARAAIAILGVIFLIGSTADIQRIAGDNIAGNRLDEEQAYVIERYIQQYEAETGNEVKYLAFGNDDAVRYGYDSVHITNMDTNLRFGAVGWAAVPAMNYYTDRNYQQKTMTAEEKSYYFQDVSYDYFDPNQQIRFDKDTAYILVY